jgi:hypothetical protein
MRPDPRAALFALALALPGVAAADWMSEYDRGLRALRAGNHEVAEAHFRAAIREKRDPVERQRFQGQRFDAYVPQHFAAVAAAARGDCDRAIEYWEQPGVAAVLSKLPALQAEQAGGAAACRQQLAATRPSPPAVAATAPVVDPAATQPAPEPVAVDPPRAPDAAATTADVAAAPVASATPVSAAPPPAARTAPPAVAARPAPATTRARAPDELARAVDAWLAGRYQDLLKAPAPATDDAAARAQVLLLRAAARFVLVELDGGDAAALAAVGNEVRAAKAANAALAPDPTMFPPRFRAYWQQVR